MSYSVYIDHPDDLGAYTFLPGELRGDDVVSRVVGIRVTFICNALAKISKGDLYEVPFDNPEDAMAFILRCKFNLVDRETVEQYKNSQRKR